MTSVWDDFAGLGDLGAAIADGLDPPAGLYVPHEPEPPQRLFLELTVRDALYGGAAGGGKSDALLMAALEYVDVPNYAAILFRRTYKDLNKPGALMDRSKQWLSGTDAKWNQNDYRWTFPSGATLSFGYLQTANDKYDHQSAEYQFVGFDEMTQFAELDVLYLFSRLRRLAGSDVPIRMRGASNPGGVGHRWVKDRYIIPHETGTMPEDRAFVPAKLDDNPHLDREDYEQSLEQLDEFTRVQLREGNWDARMPGPYVLDSRGLDAAFELGDHLDRMHAEGNLTPPVGGTVPIGIDFGESTHVLVGWPLERGGMFIKEEYTYSRGEPDTQAQFFHDQVLVKYRPPYSVGRQRFDDSKPESMRLWVRGLLPLLSEGEGKPSKIAFNRFKRQSILHMRKMLEQTQKWLGLYEHPQDPSRNVTEKHLAVNLPDRLAISRTGCPVLYEQIYEWQFKDDDTEDVKKENDHGPDAAVCIVAPLSAKGPE